MYQNNYFAGLFDSVGQLRFLDSGPRLTLSQPKADAILECYRLWPGKLYCEVPLQHSASWLTIRLDDQAALDFLRAIRPFSIDKHDQIDFVLAAVENRHIDCAAIQKQLNEISNSQFSKQDIKWVRPNDKTDKICIVAGCDKPVNAKRKCKKHYEHQRKERKQEGLINDHVHEYSRLREPSKAELAYLAGFFDGVGQIDFTKGYIYIVRPYLDALFAFRDIYGGGVTPVSEEVYARPHGEFRLYPYRGVCTLLEDLLPYLSTKKKVAASFLDCWRPGIPQKDIVQLQADSIISLDLNEETLKQEALMLKILHPTYVAGFADAELCFRLNYSMSGQRWIPEIACGQTRPQAVNMLRQQYGGSLTLAHKKPPDKDQLAWKLATFDGIKNFLSEVSPFLLEKGPEAAELAKAFSIDLTKIEEGLPINENLTALKKASSIPEEGFDQPSKTLKVKVDYCVVPGCKLRIRSGELCYKHHAEAKQQPDWVDGRLQVDPFSYKKIPSEEEKQYIAGYFDGDGNVHAEYTHLQVVFGQTKSPGILLMQSIYGGSIILDKLPTNKKKNLVARYQLRAREAVLQFLRDVQPFVLEKKAIVDLILNCWRPRLSIEEWTKIEQEMAAHFSYRMPEDILLYL